jgi:hypothetical protein
MFRTLPLGLVAVLGELLLRGRRGFNRLVGSRRVRHIRLFEPCLLFTSAEAERELHQLIARERLGLASVSGDQRLLEAQLRALELGRQRCAFVSEAVALVGDLREGGEQRGDEHALLG